MNRENDKKLAYLTILVTVGYLFWRLFYTLPWEYSVFSIVFGLVLVIAEVIGLLEQIVHFTMMSNTSKPDLSKIESIDYKSVDVFIATYNEPMELLYKTVNGCMQLEYPNKEKVNIYLCDDGNREEARKLARQFGIHYLARPDHEGAKAGNLNYAMGQSNGELIATLDADMIPMHDFLMACVPYFSLSDKIGFVQTPQSFYNLDLFQYFLYADDIIPNEQDYFYHDIELAKNSTNSVIYGGSNTVLSRQALNEIGGFVTDVITEDFATGMSIQAKGYQCYAMDEVHASGLAPTDLENLIKQRRRWARGCIQTGKKKGLLSQKGLNWKQKLSYFVSITYWYDSIKRLIFIIAPLLFMLFGVQAYIATPLQLLGIWFPMYLLNSYTMKRYSNNRRTIRWTNIYETIMFPLLFKDVIIEAIGKSETKFQVTRKEKQQEQQRYPWRIAIPHIILSGCTFYSIFAAIGWMFQTGSVSIVFTLFWLIMNMYNLIIALFFMLGRPSYRRFERFKIHEEAVVRFEQNEIKGMTYDISEGGFSIEILEKVDWKKETLVSVELQSKRYRSQFQARFLHEIETQEKFRYSFGIENISEDDYRELLNILHDRVPPMQRYIDKNQGVMDDLHNNIARRMLKRQRKPKGDEENYNGKEPTL